MTIKQAFLIAAHAVQRNPSLVQNLLVMECQQVAGTSSDIAANIPAITVPGGPDKMEEEAEAEKEVKEEKEEKEKVEEEEREMALSVAYESIPIESIAKSTGMASKEVRKIIRGFVDWANLSAGELSETPLRNAGAYESVAKSKGMTLEEVTQVVKAFAALAVSHAKKAGNSSLKKVSLKTTPAKGNCINFLVIAKKPLKTKKKRKM